MLGCNREAADRAQSDTRPDTVGCAFELTNSHPDPRQLILEFVRRDSSGEFRGASVWFAGAVDCPGHEPGPDVASEISGYHLRFLSETRDTVRAEVLWTRLGYVSANGSEESLGTEVDTLAAVRTPYGWRIKSPALNPHVPAMVPQEPSGKVR